MTYILQEIYQQILSRLEGQLPYDSNINMEVIRKTKEKLEKMKGYQRIARPWKQIIPSCQVSKPAEQPNLKLIREPSSRMKIESEDLEFVDPEQEIEKPQIAEQKAESQPEPIQDEYPSLSDDSSDQRLYEIVQNSVTLGIYGLRTSYYRTKTKTINMKLEDVIIKNPRQQFVVQRLNTRLDVVLNVDIESLL